MPDDRTPRPTADDAPWWARPAQDADPASGAYAAPRPGEQPPYGSPSGDAGSWGAPTGGPAFSPSGYGQPSFPTRALPDVATGAHPWGYPTDSLGGPGQTAPPRPRRGLGVGALVLAAALVGGLTGGALVASRDEGGSNLDPSVSLGAPASTMERSVARDPASVAGIADQVLQSTVSISVETPGGSGSGSGVVLREDGYILTNNHVVEQAAEGGRITVVVNGGTGRQLPAEIVGLDRVTDLAVLKVDGVALEPATLGRSSDLVVGDPVIAVGSPLGLSGTVTTGIVSALNRTVNVPGDGDRPASPLLNAIQTDAAINPGNSGGALVDGSGAVIGINSAIATVGGGEVGGSIGVGFAIPIDEARDVAEEIIATGRATHPAIGVEAGNQTTDDGLKQGARVTRVVAGGPAADAGLEVGDVVTRVQDLDTGSVDELILALRQFDVGDTVTVTYLRGGQEQTAEAVLVDRAQD